MLVKVLNFGTNWWSRFGRDFEDPDRFASHAAHYNSTGIRCGGKIRRHWIEPGLVRINGAIDFNPNLCDRSIGQTFVCSNLAHTLGGNRLLMKSKSARSAVPDCYLVVVSSEEHGKLDFSSTVWKSIFSSVIAVSQLRDRQEAMLLMKIDEWVQTSKGFWQLQVASNRCQVALVRVGDPVS